MKMQKTRKKAAPVSGTRRSPLIATLVVAAIMAVAVITLVSKQVVKGNGGDAGNGPNNAETPGAVAENSGKKYVTVKVAGREVQVDPQTGQIKPLTPQEAKRLADGLKVMLNQSTEGLVEVHHPDGSVSMDLQGWREYICSSNWLCWLRPCWLLGGRAFGGLNSEQLRIDSEERSRGLRIVDAGLGNRPIRFSASDHHVLKPRFHWLLLTLAVSLFVSSTAFGQATIVIQQGAGFNDPTPVAPVGGNDGTTLGQQRLNAFQFAASIWAATINSNVTIRVQSSWEPRPCTATGGTGGSSSSGNPFRNFPGAPQNTWFVQALANSFAGTDLDPGAADMSVILNVNIGNPDCFANMSWYLGFDGKNPPNSIDAVAGLLHEFGHGLGFQTFTNRSSGAQMAGFPSMFDTFLFDKVIGKTWPQMTDSERAVSATNTGNLVWTGPQVTADVPNVLGTPRLRINTPRAIAGDYLGAVVVFGALLASPGVTGNVIQALDPSVVTGLLRRMVVQL